MKVLIFEDLDVRKLALRLQDQLKKRNLSVGVKECHEDWVNLAKQAATDGRHQLWLVDLSIDKKREPPFAGYGQLLTEAESTINAASDTDPQFRELYEIACSQHDAVFDYKEKPGIWLLLFAREHQIPCRVFSIHASAYHQLLAYLVTGEPGAKYENVAFDKANLLNPMTSAEGPAAEWNELCDLVSRLDREEKGLPANPEGSGGQDLYTGARPIEVHGLKVSRRSLNIALIIGIPSLLIAAISLYLTFRSLPQPLPPDVQSFVASVNPQPNRPSFRLDGGNLNLAPLLSDSFHIDARLGNKAHCCLLVLTPDGKIGERQDFRDRQELHCDLLLEGPNRPPIDRGVLSIVLLVSRSPRDPGQDICDRLEDAWRIAVTHPQLKSTKGIWRCNGGSDAEPVVDSGKAIVGPFTTPQPLLDLGRHLIKEREQEKNDLHAVYLLAFSVE